jgi:hypothetical protein
MSINGSAVPDSRVTLIGNDASRKRVTVSDSLGRFTFTDLPPGTFHLMIVSAGLRNFTSDAIVLGAGESRELPPTALPIKTRDTSTRAKAVSTHERFMRSERPSLHEETTAICNQTTPTFSATSLRPASRIFIGPQGIAARR